MQSPLVSIIIVNWNHEQYLKKCLDSLSNQNFRDFDICIVDNGSTDGSGEWIANNSRELNTVSFPDNRGFSKAFNWGVKHTSGEFVLSLNPDVFVEQNFLQEIVNSMNQDENVGIVSPKLLRVEDATIIDSTGLFINRFRRPYDRGQGEIDKGQYDNSFQIFGACGAAALYRRAMLVDIALHDEFFDEDFFAYYEDADLAWRAQLRGWNARYAPKAVATHVRGWGDTLHKRNKLSKDNVGPRLALRNRWIMILKNDALRYFLLDFPSIVVMEFSRLLYMAIFAPDALWGLRDILASSRHARDKRKIIRDRMLVNDASLRPWFIAEKIQHQ